MLWMSHMLIGCTFLIAPGNIKRTARQVEFVNEAWKRALGVQLASIFQYARQSQSQMGR
jgi:hypothetical protein